MIEAVDAVLGVDALDRHHRHQHLDLGNLCRVAGEQRFDVIRARRLHHEVDPVSRDVDAGEGVDDFVDLRDHDATTKRRGLDDHRGVFGIRPGVQVAVPICGLCCDQRHARGQVDEVAAEQFQVGVDGADLDASLGHQGGQPHRRRAGEGEVQPGGDAAFENIQAGKCLGEEVGLLLVVALQADLVTRLQQRVQQFADIGGRDLMAAGPARSALQACPAAALQRIPARVHRPASDWR
ncbi:hypothetical protein G6F57_018309 [Rhizopus arrhizus]|nr:hypothetical protein G6F57_018309 [Rhizopus arrhizus]